MLQSVMTLFFHLFLSFSLFWSAPDMMADKSSPAIKSGYQAYARLYNQGLTNSPYLIVVDFTIPSNKKRLYLIDMRTKSIVYTTYVTHGAGSGKGKIPVRFSNQPGSHASSLGAYLTRDEYRGSKGRSLKLVGVDRGVNDRALERAVVIHGASYIGGGRTGTSWGCFAVPMSEINRFLNLLPEGTVLSAYSNLRAT